MPVHSEKGSEEGSCGENDKTEVHDPPKKKTSTSREIESSGGKRYGRKTLIETPQPEVSGHSKKKASFSSGSHASGGKLTGNNVMNDEKGSNIGGKQQSDVFGTSEKEKISDIQGATPSVSGADLSEKEGTQEGVLLCPKMMKVFKEATMLMEKYYNQNS